MKKLLTLAACLVLAALPLRAQLAADAGFMHGFEKTSVTLLGQTRTGNSSLDGIYAGAKYNFPITEGLSIAPGANLSFLFGKYFDDNNTKLQELAVNVPVHVMYTLPLMSDLSLQFMAGPTLQLGIFHSGVDSTENPKQTYDFYKSYKILNVEALPARNRFNVYMGAAVGANVADRFLVNVGFDFGLLNMSTGDNWKISRNVLKIGLGYIF